MQEERKLVTVLFADIVGSTTGVRAHDPELVRSTLAATFEQMRRLLVSHGGTVEKFIGDAVMAVFGVPSAHDDDAERAVRAAFALRDRIERRNRDSPMPLALRIGVNTGEAVAGGGGAELLVTGEPVNVAARLQQAAMPGQILVGPLTRSLTQSAIRYGRARRAKAKGLGLLEAFPAQAITSEVPAQRRGLKGLRAPLIGREDELAHLIQAHRRLSGSERAYLVTVFGPAGSGKSRLVAEFVHAIGAARVRHGRCPPYGEGITLYPLQLILRADLGLASTDSKEAARAKLAAAVRQAFGASDEADGVARRLSAIAGLLGADEALPGVAQEDVPEELRWGLRRYLERRAAGDPLVLVFEDIHWAEPALLDIIEDLTQWSRAPLLVVCLARPEFLDGRPGWGGGKMNASAITLDPLTAEETRRLVAELLEVDALPDPLRREVLTRAEGNPLFVEEFLRMLIEAGQIERRGGRWIAPGHVAPLVVPPTLQGLIAARVDRGSPEVKRLLQHAAVIGRFFSANALAAIAERPFATDTLRDAARRDLLVEADEPGAGGARLYRFKHVLIRDVVYAGVPKADRARLHDHYARWYESTLGERSRESIEIIAQHAEQAFLLARELRAPETAELGRRAFDRLRIAATQARKRVDLHAALALYERAAAIAEAIEVAPQEHAEAVGFAAISSWSLSISSDVVPKLDAAIEMARAVGPSEVLSRLLNARAMATRNESVERARAFHDEAIAVARASGDVSVLVDALAYSAVLAWWTGDIDGATRIRREVEAIGLEHRAILDPLQLLILRWDIAFEGGNVSTLAHLVAEAERIAASGGSERARRVALDWGGELAELTGDTGKAVARRRLYLELAPELGGFVRGHAEIHLGKSLRDSGDLEGARELLEKGVESLSAVVMRGARAWSQQELARCYLARGDLDAAGHLAELARETALQFHPDGRAFTNATLAAVRAATGEVREAEALFREALAILEPTSLRQRRALVREEFGAFLLDQGRPLEARPLLEVARAFWSDPLATKRREQIDALLRRCDAVSVKQ